MIEIRVPDFKNAIMTFYTKYDPAPCDKKYQTLFPLFGEGLGTRLRLSVCARACTQATPFLIHSARSSSMASKELHKVISRSYLLLVHFGTEISSFFDCSRCAFCAFSAGTVLQSTTYGRG